MKNTELVGKRIREARLAANLTAEELGEKIGKTQTTILRYETGTIEKVPVNIISDIADVLKVSPAYLMGWDRNAKFIPLEDCISFYPDLISCQIDVQSWIALPLDFFPNPSDYVAVKVMDNYMAPIIRKNDLAIFKKNKIIKSREIGLFRLNESYCIKRYICSSSGTIWLTDNYNPPVQVALNDNFEVKGILIKRLSDIDE